MTSAGGPGRFVRELLRGVMIRTVRVGDIVGFRTFTSVIRYGEVVDVLARGEGGRPNRRDEISVRLKPDGQVVMVQRWRLAERYDRRKIDVSRNDKGIRKRTTECE